ncbi:N-acylneuraminate-9-phosphatase [Erpetoichthys calabaricus]|uniref:N-acetylneuraminic acid phosphatase n=1 Tax=Erpetoichthys calabaricus TaxID=27687 RepID=A0A8C4T648_ERPCA|nr:N-acylneuraminate-9-phosphatase [Erpetoichthys calabaricus]
MESHECSTVKAIMFDLDNTLIDTAGVGVLALEKVTELLQSRLGAENNAADICRKFSVKLLKEEFDPSKTTIDDLRISHWEEAIQEVKGTGASRSLAEECYLMWKFTRLQHLAIAEPARNMLVELRKVYKLLLLTNGDTQTQREKVNAVGAEAWFDAVVIGGDYKEQKPAASIFLTCCEILDVKPSCCVMVGDSFDTDIQGGINAGFKATIWLCTSDKKFKEELISPPYLINSVLDVPKILNIINKKQSN